MKHHFLSSIVKNGTMTNGLRVLHALRKENYSRTMKHFIRKMVMERRREMEEKVKRVEEERLFHSGYCRMQHQE